MKLNGVLNVNKGPGLTSHDVVDQVRKLVPKKTKVGHAGTLDPMARGVLPICIGAATKLFPYLLECRKTYRAEMMFGRVTDTQDTTGETLSETDPGEIRLSEMQRLLDTFRGKSVQVPPMYSALKVGGTRLHELARAGVEVEREGRPIEVFDISAIRAEGARLEFEVTCSRGTYIRVLCHDLGALQGSGGCMTALTRTALGPFSLEAAITIEEAERLARDGGLAAALLSLSDALGHVPAVRVSPAAEGRFRNGVPLGPRDWASERKDASPGKVRVLSQAGEFIGVGRLAGPENGGGGSVRILPERIFVRD